MAKFLRDEQLSNITITREAIMQIVEVLATHGLTMPEYDANVPNDQQDVYIFYTIRFDQKGYQVGNMTQLLSYFEQATDVERIIFELASGDSRGTTRVSGSYLDLTLQKDNQVHSFLTVSSDNEGWVTAAFADVKEVLTRHKNRHAFVRNEWSDLIIQVAGVAVGFAFSIWAASEIAPSLKVENAFVISFIIVLILFSNLWTPIKQRIDRVIYSAFPVIKFYRPRTNYLNLIIQAVVVTIVSTLVVLSVTAIVDFVGTTLGQFMK